MCPEAGAAPTMRIPGVGLRPVVGGLVAPRGRGGMGVRGAARPRVYARAQAPGQRRTEARRGAGVMAATREAARRNFTRLGGAAGARRGAARGRR